MFKELAKLLDAPGAALTLNVVALEGGRLSVVVIPKGEWKDKTLGTGMSVQATPEELDEGLAEQISRYRVAHKSLKEQVDSTLSVISAAEKESAGKASTAIKKAAAGPTKPVAPVKPVVASTTAAVGHSTAGEEEADGVVDLF
jgi:PRTRC genetic system protein E